MSFSRRALLRRAAAVALAPVAAQLAPAPASIDAPVVGGLEETVEEFEVGFEESLAYQHMQALQRLFLEEEERIFSPSKM